jgi:ElaB/YqjD/DUF883 family membrane-anchored ribosome-binding protein
MTSHASSSESPLDGAIAATRQAAREAVDGLSDAVRDLHDAAAPLIEASGRQAGDMAEQGRRDLQDGTRRLRLRARRAGDRAVHYIQDEPVTAMMMAAATGAALTALIGLVLTTWRSR